MTPEQIQKIVTVVADYVLPALGVIITVFLIPFIKSKIGESKWNKAVSFAETAVRAAEQMFGAGLGGKKRQYVYEYLASKCKWLTKEQIEQLIESAAFEVSKAIDSSKGGKFDINEYVGDPTVAEEKPVEKTDEQPDDLDSDNSDVVTVSVEQPEEKKVAKIGLFRKKSVEPESEVVEVPEEVKHEEEVVEAKKEPKRKITLG